MIAIFSDTHSDRGHELDGEALTAAREAAVVIHAGDFKSIPALEAFEEVSTRLYGVYGNVDSAAVRDRLPETRIVEHDGIRLAVAHRRNGGQTGLATFGRSNDADIVVSGHSHQPTVVDTGDCLLVNPGSHAQPRGNRPGFATITVTDGEIQGQISEPDGTVIEPIERTR